MTDKTARTPAATDGYLLGRNPLVGLALLLVGAIVFAVVAVGVGNNGLLVQWDQGIIQSLHTQATQASAFMVSLMRFFGQLGHTYFIYASIGLLVLTLLLRRWRAFFMLLIGVIGGNLWFQILTGFFARPRPTFSDPLETVAGPGFPSGHAIRAVLLLGLLLYLAWPYLRSWGWRLLAAAAVVVVIVLIGYSRVFLGSHYPTDIIAGAAFGLAWGALSYTGIELAALWLVKRLHPAQSQVAGARTA